MIIGGSLSKFSNLDFRRAAEIYLTLAKDFDLKAVEIKLERESGSASLWPSEVDGDVGRFLSQFECPGIHLPFLYLDPVSPNSAIAEESINQLKQSLEIAAEQGAAYAVMHARGSMHTPDVIKQTEKWLDVISHMADLAEKRSMPLYLENADFFHNLRQLTTVIRKLKSRRLGIALDVGHAHIRGVAPLSTFPWRDLALRAKDLVLPLSMIGKNMPYEQYGSLRNFIETEGDLIGVVHVHDFNGKNDHLPLGKGKIDFSFMSGFKKSSFAGPYILESALINHYSDFGRNYKVFMRLA